MIKDAKPRRDNKTVKDTARDGRGDKEHITRTALYRYARPDKKW